MNAIGLEWSWFWEIPFKTVAAGLFVLGMLLLLSYYKTVKLGLPSFGRWPFVRDDRLYWIVVRRVCPICHGVMVPKKDLVQAGSTLSTFVWECSRNSEHKLSYDCTEVQDAINKGELNHLHNKAT